MTVKEVMLNGLIHAMFKWGICFVLTFLVGNAYLIYLEYFREE